MGLGNSAWTPDLNRPPVGASSPNNALESATEWILSKNTDEDWIARFPGLGRPLDELDEIVEKRRLHLILGRRGEWLSCVPVIGHEQRHGEKADFQSGALHRFV